MRARWLAIAIVTAACLSAPVGCARLQPAVEWTRKALCFDHKLEPVAGKPGEFKCARCGQEFKLAQ